MAKKFDMQSASYEEYIAHLETYIVGLDKCTDPVQVAEAVNAYRGANRTGSKRDVETALFLRKHCGYEHGYINPTRD